MDKPKKKQRDTSMTEVRNEWLLREYYNVLKRHGKYASRLSKRELYEEAAVPFFISTSHAQHLIESMLRKKPQQLNYCIEEIEAIMTSFKIIRNDS